MSGSMLYMRDARFLKITGSPPLLTHCSLELALALVKILGKLTNQLQKMTDFGSGQMPVHRMSDTVLQPVMRSKCV